MSDKGCLGTVVNPETDSLNYGPLEITLLFPLISSAFLVFKILFFRYGKYTRHMHAMSLKSFILKNGKMTIYRHFSLNL